MRGCWFITPHAVARYRERVRPNCSYEDALEDLIHESEHAHLIGYSGPLQQWRGARPRRLRFRVATGGDGKPQLVTVLPPFDGWKP